jgi:cell division protein FtsZ
VREAAHPDANIIFGAVIDDAMGDEVRITVIAAGFDRFDGERGAVPEKRETAAAPRVGRRPDARRAGLGLDAGDDLGEGDDEEGDDEFDVPEFLR